MSEIPEDVITSHNPDTLKSFVVETGGDAFQFNDASSLTQSAKWQAAYDHCNQPIESGRQLLCVRLSAWYIISLEIDSYLGMCVPGLERNRIRCSSILKIFHTVLHVLGFENAPNENERANDRSCAPRVLVTISDIFVMSPLGVQREEVVVVRDDHPRFADRESNMSRIIGALQSRFERGCHVNSASTQAFGD